MTVHGNLVGRTVAEKGKYPRIVERCGKSPPQYPDNEDDEGYEEDEDSDE